MPSPKSASLTRPVHPISHRPLRTVKDAIEYMLALPGPVALLTHWQHAARLCMGATEAPTAHAIAALTDQLELALMLSWRLDLSVVTKRPPAASVRTAAPRSRRRRLN